MWDKTGVTLGDDLREFIVHSLIRYLRFHCMFMFGLQQTLGYSRTLLLNGFKKHQEKI